MCKNNNHLITLLGEWVNIERPSSSRYDPIQQQLYLHCNDTWTAHSTTKATQKALYFSRHGTPSDLPASTISILDLIVQQTTYSCTIPSPLKTSPSMTPEFTTFKEYINALLQWTHDLLCNINFIDDEEELCLFLQGIEHMYFVTEGSETEGTGYFGWVAAATCDNLVENNGHSSSAQYLMELLRTESTSILLLL
eukprot:14607550-Ditylum_brightwellii.AAC.1